MFGDILSGYPILGHLKAFFHLACGHFIIFGRDFFRATTLIYIVGGIVSAGGPVGMITGAVVTGCTVDHVDSIVTNRPIGYLDANADLIDDLRNQIRPRKGLLKMMLYAGADILCGFVGALHITVNSGSPTAVDIPARKSSVVSLVLPCLWMVTGLLLRRVAMTSVPSILRFYCFEDFTVDSTDTFKSDTDLEPQDTDMAVTDTFKSDTDLEPQDTDMAVFLKLFKVKKIDDIVIRGQRIFANIGVNRKMSLEKLLKQLRLNGYMVIVIESVRILLHHDRKDRQVSFEIFMSGSKFVATYIGEYVARVYEEHILICGVSSRFRKKCRIDTDVVKEEILEDLLHTWDDLYTRVGYFNCVSHFRNIPCAMYQYWKHKVITGKGNVLSVLQYFALVETLMKSVVELKEYEQMCNELETCNALETRRELICDFSYLKTFGMKVRIVLKIKDAPGEVKLTACYMVYDRYCSQDGTVSIDKNGTSNL